jgi:hypothetical protein
LASLSVPVLAAVNPLHVSAAQVRAGDGTAMVVDFLAWALAHQVRVVGGLPTGFADAPIPDATVAAIAAVFSAHGGCFLLLPNRSRYPRSAFFDTPEHLNEPAQIAHSRTVAMALRDILDSE